MKPINERLERIESQEPVILENLDGTTRTEMVTVPAWRDPKDGEIYLDADSVAILDRFRARHSGVLSPQDLDKLRERLGLTQNDIANLLQIGEKTWSRWETGREAPSRSLNLLLLALYEGKINLPWLKAKLENKGQLTSEPSLRVRGWQKMLQEPRSLLWLDNILLAQEDWSLALRGVSAFPVMHELWISGYIDQTCFKIEPISSHLRGSQTPSPVMPKYEEMPLGA